MTLGQFSALCRALPATTGVILPDGSHVWKVGGKVFAIGSDENGKPSFSFRVSDAAYDMLKDRPGLRPAPSRGLRWIEHFKRRGLSESGLRDYIRQSHVIVAKDLSTTRRTELGLEGRDGTRRSWSSQRKAQKAGR
jgi:predicted DNA-binding protein (MmcQ/YjbR family)